MRTDTRHPVRVLVRADAGPRIGTGHVMRCLSLANELAARGASIVVATHAPDSLVARLGASGHTVTRLGDLDPSLSREPSRVWSDDEQRIDATTTKAAVGDDFDVVVVDHYGLSAPWESAFAERSRLLAVDDLANRPHDVDIVTDQNWYGPGSGARDEGLVRPDTVRLLGPRYAILQRAYRRVIRPAPVRVPPRRLLVSFGGTDPGGETTKVLEAIDVASFAALTVDVVVGTADQVSPSLRALVASRARTNLHVAVSSLAPLLAQADFAIGASGAATWERMATGVPAMVTTVAPHQSGVTAALHDARVTRWLGLVDQTDASTYRAALLDVLDAPGGWAPRIVDGFGAGRLAEALAPSTPTDLRRRPVESFDAGAVLGLQAESVGDGEAPNGLLGGPDAWRHEEQRFDALIAAGTGGTMIEANGVPIAITESTTDATWIQRCVTDAELRASIGAAPSGPGRRPRIDSGS